MLQLGHSTIFCDLLNWQEEITDCTEGCSTEEGWRSLEQNRSLKPTQAMRVAIFSLWYVQLLCRNTESRDTVLDQNATGTNGQ